MNLSDSKVGKKHQNWLINQMIASFIKNTEINNVWSKLSDKDKLDIYQDIHETLRYNI